MKTILTILILSMAQMLSAQFLNPTLDIWNTPSPMFPFEHLADWRSTNKVLDGALSISVTKEEENGRIFARIQSNQAWTDVSGSGHIEQEISTDNLKGITYVSRCDSVELLGGCIIQILNLDDEILLSDTTFMVSDTFDQKMLTVPTQIVEGNASIKVRFHAQGHHFGSYPEPELDGYTVFDIDNVKVDFISSVNEPILDSDLLDVYPNPSPGIFRLDLSRNLSAKSVEVFNLQGQVVWYGQYSNRLDLSQLINGNYIISVRTESGVVAKRVSIL